MASNVELDYEQRKRSIFVTQLREERDCDETDATINRTLCEETTYAMKIIPRLSMDYEIIWDEKYRSFLHQPPSELLSNCTKTLQSTLLVKQASEADKIERELQKKRNDFEEKMLFCKNKEAILRKRQQQIEERVNKFDKFITETEAKRRRALEKYQNEKKLNEKKMKEFEFYTEEFENLRKRHKQLQNKVNKFSVYQKYLMKVAETTPEDYFNNTNDSELLGIMARYKTLYTTYQILSTTQNKKTEEIEWCHHVIQNAKQQYYQDILIDNGRIARLQTQLEDLTHSNAHLEHVLQTNEEIYRQQRTILGQVKLAVVNLAEKCMRKHCKSLVNLDIFQMLSAIQEFIKEHVDICRMAKNAKTPELLENSEQSNIDDRMRMVGKYQCRLSLSIHRTSQSDEIV